MLFTSCTTLIGDEEISFKYVMKGLCLNLVGYYIMVRLKNRITTYDDKEVSSLTWMFELTFLFLFLVWKPFEFFFLCGLVCLPILGVIKGFANRYIQNKKKKMRSAKQKKMIETAVESSEEAIEKKPVKKTVKKQPQKKNSTSKKEKSTKSKKTTKTTAKNDNTSDQSITDDSLPESKQPEKKRQSVRKDSRQTEISKKKTAIEQLESDIAEKKTQCVSLGTDAMALMQKAKINNEIKTLQTQIENLKNDIAKLENIENQEESL